MSAVVTTRAQAEATVAAGLAPGSGYVVDPEATIEHAVGWAVAVVSAEFLRTRDPAHRSFGLGRTVVTSGGEVFHCGSGQPLDVCLEDVAVLIGKGSLGARLRHARRKFLGAMVVSRAPSP